MRFHVPIILLLVSLCGCAGTSHSNAVVESNQPIKWENWSDDVFDRAKRENKFVLLDLQAVWCHWCHVMDDTTYRDPKVAGLIASKYIAVKVDQDSRPDLSNRYEDYGWPATVVFAPDGSEFVKRRGYIPPPAMVSMLQAIIKDPTPGPSVVNDTPPSTDSPDSLAPSRRAELIDRLTKFYADKAAGWAGDHKFVDPDVVEYCLINGDAKQKQMAIDTLVAMRKLIDPVWGGVYQYSIDGDWDHPHFEKIMFYQANDMRIYAQAFLATGDSADLRAAQDIHKFLTTFLMSPQGAFYVSQDADVVDTQEQESDAYFKLDDAHRRQRGVPRVDTHIYSRENGWAISGLVQLYDATANTTADAKVLNEAIAAANWIIANRTIDGGGFRHDSTDAAGPFLGDTLAMGQAFLSLYGSTGDRAWLKRASDAADFIAAHFVNENPGIVTSAGKLTGPTAARPQLDENVAAARFANLLFHYDGIAKHRELAQRAMRYLAAPQSTETRGWVVGGVLLADKEINTEPLHVAVVGAKSDPLAGTLFKTALTSPTFYKRVEWFDRTEGNLPNADVEYPVLPTAAAFLCTNGACSSPISDPAKLASKIKK